MKKNKKPEDFRIEISEKLVSKIKKASRGQRREIPYWPLSQARNTSLEFAVLTELKITYFRYYPDI